jgi:N-hydroxyarylamine O-acetyltransferase
MDNKAFQRDIYLERIHHSGQVPLSEGGLVDLHRAQVCTIPFENFDILLGRGISLASTAIFDKLVRHARGGYCFELNGLFFMALKAFGFDARPILARVHRSGTPMGRGHQISLVSLSGRKWIVDVGFGSPHLPFPLPLEINRVATHNKESFRFIEAEPYGIMLQILQKCRWQDLYSFDLGHVCPGDIVYGNHYTSTHPDSFFTCSRVAALATQSGRITLFNYTLRQFIAGTERVHELMEGQMYIKALKDHFGIDLNVPYEALPSLQPQYTEKISRIGL